VVVASAPAPVVVAGTPTAVVSTDTRTGSPATVVVKAPAGVRLTVNDQPTALSKTEETFTTPRLQPGLPYSYVFKAEAVREGKPITVTRRVTVRAGEESRVDLTDMMKAEPPNRVPADVARVTVLLPADARLSVDGVPLRSGSAKRTFDTPKIEPGRSYHYTFTAEVVRDGQTYTRDRRVDVEAGKDVTVDFKDLPPVQAARR
jgi:uncharacterized protein (TIGR03000 family)